MKKSLIVSMLFLVASPVVFADESPIDLKSAPTQMAIAQANKWMENPNAKPVPGDNGKIVFTFGESQPTIVCAPLRACDIELEPGEMVLDKPHAGDPVRWSIEPAISGVGATKTVHVIIKPREEGLDTNLVIPTDRRMYHLRIVSAQKNYMPAVAFYYLDTEQKLWEAHQAQLQKEEAIRVAEFPALTVDKLNFNYRANKQRGKPAFIPVRVFDDGEKTYIQMPQAMQNREAPSLVLIGSDKTEQLVNYRLKGGYYIVDRIFDKAALIAGVGKHQDRVIISRYSQCATRYPNQARSCWN
jgi:type IV secretion system protein VirB9